MKTLSTLFGMALVLGIGADQSLAATWVVNTTGDSVDVTPGDGVCADFVGLCSLRAAVMQANADSISDTIVLNVPLVQLSIPWQAIDDHSSGDLDVLGPVTIEGGGATVEWSSAVPAYARDRFFHFFPSSAAFEARINRLTVRGGLATPVEVIPLVFRSVGGGILIRTAALFASRWSWTTSTWSRTPPCIKGAGSGVTATST